MAVVASLQAEYNQEPDPVTGADVLFRLGCLFVLVPLIELALLIRVGQWIGLGPTLAIVVTTGILGAWLARREGIRALTAVQVELAGGKLPGQSLMDGAAVLMGGALLLTPGILTDLTGFLLLVPTTRGLVFRWVRGRMERGIRTGNLRVSVWNVEGFPPGPTDPKGRTGGPGSHGRETGFPFSSRGGRPGASGDSDDEEPPRPGEIVQE